MSAGDEGSMLYSESAKTDLITLDNLDVECMRSYKSDEIYNATVFKQYKWHNPIFIMNAKKVWSYESTY